jgi:hypothetical protein
MDSKALLFTGSGEKTATHFGIRRISKFRFPFHTGNLASAGMSKQSNPSPILPPDFDCIKVVHSFDELASTPFGNGVNAFCWPRVLAGDFCEVVEKIDSGDGITLLDEVFLRGLPLSHAGLVAINEMLQDERLLSALGLDPVLNCIHAYPSDDNAVPVSTDVYSFHADSAPVQSETWLCTYFGASSEAIRNEEAVRHVDIPKTRAHLLKLYGGQDDEGFWEFLSENCYDLHYAALPHAEPYPFGIANLWRIAVQYPGCPVPPCIHRAPRTNSPRLLLIS